MKLYESAENYLENILILKQRTGFVRSVDLAMEMNFSKPSVSRAVHLLEDQQLIVIGEGGGIEFDRGRTENRRKCSEILPDDHRKPAATDCGSLPGSGTAISDGSRCECFLPCPW